MADALRQTLDNVRQQRDVGRAAMVRADELLSADPPKVKEAVAALRRGLAGYAPTTGGDRPWLTQPSPIMASPSAECGTMGERAEDDGAEWLDDASEEAYCDHEEADLDILTGRATCGRCGHIWYPSWQEFRAMRGAQG